MTSIILPAPNSALPPAAYHASRFGAGFEEMRFEIEPSPMASLVTVSAWLRGHEEGILRTPTALLSILDEDQVVACAGEGYLDHLEFFVLSTAATIRVEPDKRRVVRIALKQTRFIVDGGGCTLARMAVAF